MHFQNSNLWETFFLGGQNQILIFVKSQNLTIVNCLSGQIDFLGCHTALDLVNHSAAALKSANYFNLIFQVNSASRKHDTYIVLLLGYSNYGASWNINYVPSLHYSLIHDGPRCKITRMLQCLLRSLPFNGRPRK